MKTDNIVRDKSFEFAVRIVNLQQYLCSERREYVLSKQILRSGTSVGANIHEAIQGVSKKDFVYRMNISLKEAGETEYWLKLFKRTGLLSEEEFESLNHDCEELIRLLTAIVKTSRNRSVQQELK